MRARVCLALFIGLLSAVPGSLAGAQTPPPTAAAAGSCGSPNAPARVVMAAPAEAPPLAVQQGVWGVVTVNVSLDATSHVVRSTIRTSPWPLLNTAALAAVQKSTFATQITNCVPMATTLAYPVSFAQPVMTGAVPDIGAYFIGTWYCASELHSQSVEVFGRDVYGGAVMVYANAYVSPERGLYQSIIRYSQAGGVTTLSGPFENRLFIATSHGWNGNRLVFSGYATTIVFGDPAPSATQSTLQRMTFVKVDADHYNRAFEVSASPDGPWMSTSRGSCARITQTAAN